MGGYGSDYDYSVNDEVLKKSAASYNIDQKREYTIPETKEKIPPPKGKVFITKAKFPLVIIIRYFTLKVYFFILYMSKYIFIIFLSIISLFSNLFFIAFPRGLSTKLKPIFK